MYRMLFTNRWIALAFVALVVVLAVAFVGTQDHEGAFGMAKQDLQDHQQALDEQIEAVSQPDPSPEEPVEFMSDEELIDDTTGEATSGDDDTDEDYNPVAADVVEIIYPAASGADG